MPVSRPLFTTLSIGEAVKFLACDEEVCFKRFEATLYIYIFSRCFFMRRLNGLVDLLYCLALDYWNGKYHLCVYFFLFFFMWIS